MHLPSNAFLQGGKYRIIRFISAGGFGCTYEAEHVMLGKRVAIKEFFVKDFCNRDEATSRITVGTQSRKPLVNKLKKKFIEEARAISGFSHPGIVSVTDVFEENGTAYFVMSYIDGKSVAEILKSGPLPEAKVLKYIHQVSNALAYVHQRNRLHLDIKPGNIMVDPYDNAILIDFGASKQYDEEFGENTSTLMAKTPGYAPLEQMGNSVKYFSEATDIYALGATMYKMLTGVTPPEATDLASGEALPQIPTTVSANVRDAVYKAMQLQKNQRPQTIADFVALIDNSNDDSEDTLVDIPAPVHKVTAAKPGLHPQPVAENHPVPQHTHISKIPKGVWGIVTVILLTIITIVVLLFFIKTSNHNRVEPITADTVKVAVENAQAPVENPPVAKLLEEPRTFNVKGVKFNMIPVEGGSFMMGATSEQGSEADNDEKPVHRVTLSNYMIGETEVTQELWQAVMGSNPSHFKGNRRPVEMVSWDDCQEFISRLNQLTGEHFRPPTEAEWEFAARGGNKAQKQTKYSGSDTAEEVAWFYENSEKKTHDVKGKKPNLLGLYDMNGNVREWCSDWYGDYNSNSQTNPSGLSSGSNRVLRGGSWSYTARGCRVSNRNYDSPGYRCSNRGLRLAL